MKIDPGLKPVTLPPAIENRPDAPKSNRGAGAAAQTEVTLSQRAAEVKQLETRLAAVPVMDRARVDSIKEAIASGQYTINAENIAEGLIASVKEMLHVAK